VIDEAAARPQGRTAEAPTVHAAGGARDPTQTRVALLAFPGRVRFRESITRFLRSPALVLVLLLVALVFPTTNVARFDGVPLSSPHEILLLLLGATALLSPGLRRRYGRLLEHGRGAIRWILLIPAVIAIVAKAALLANGASEGFVGCYSSPVAQEATCERSFANPLSLHSATRVDREIDFGPRRQSTTDVVAYPLRDLAIGELAQSNWDLGFVNSYRFNFYKPGAVDRGRLPLSVRWTGTVAGTQSPLRVQYVGEVAIEFGGATRQLPASYSSVKRARTAIPPGRHPLRNRLSLRPCKPDRQASHGTLRAPTDSLG